MATIKTKYSIGDQIFVFHSSSIRRGFIIKIKAEIGERETQRSVTYQVRTNTGYDIGGFFEHDIHKTEASVIKAIKRI